MTTFECKHDKQAYKGKWEFACVDCGSNINVSAFERFKGLFGGWKNGRTLTAIIHEQNQPQFCNECGRFLKDERYAHSSKYGCSFMGTQLDDLAF